MPSVNNIIINIDIVSDSIGLSCNRWHSFIMVITNM